MSRSRLMAAVAAAALLGACEARFGNDAGEVPDNASAEGKAEEGMLTVQAPGFNLSVQIPEGVRSHTEMGAENGLVYPSSTFEGIHVQGSNHEGAGESHGEVELRFSTADPVERVVAWYRDPARAEDFTIESAAGQGGGFRMTGTGRQDNERFTLTVTPRAGGGAEARLLLTDSSR